MEKSIVDKTMIRFLIICLCVSISLITDAQEIKIKSFSMQMDPMTVSMQRKDNNGNVCALVKVIIPTAQAAFEGNLVGDYDFKTSEYWCYLSPGSKQLKVKYPNCDPLMVRFDDFIGSGVKSKQIYELHLEVPSTSVEQNQRIYTVSITAHSSEKSFLNKQIYVYEHMDSVTVKRYNKHGVYISSTESDHDKGKVGKYGEYKFQIGAVEGDVFEVSAIGYKKYKIKFNNPKNDVYDVSLEPERVNVQFLLRDSINKEVLIGAGAFKNPSSNSSWLSFDWDNWGDLSSKNRKSEEAASTDIEGITRVFKNAKTTDRFLFTYAGYKDKVIELTKFSNNGESLNNNIIAIELEPYIEGETHEIRIHIGGMGIHDTGNVTVTNTRTNESFTMSQKSQKNFKKTVVALGDELVFTRRGFRPVHVNFKYSIPERINIAPIKGKKTDEQFVEF